MRKSFIIAFCLILSGCLGGNLRIYPAKSMMVDGNICVFIDKGFLVENGEIRKIEITKYSDEGSIYEKYFIPTVPLQDGKCITGLNTYNFVPGSAYSVSINLHRHSYLARFIVWKDGDRLMVTDRY